MSDPYNPPNAQQPQQPYPPQHPNQPMMPQQTDGFAITSMVLGILAVLSCYFGAILGIIAVIFGHLSLGKFKRDPNLGGKGMATAGVVCGYVGIAFTIISVIIGLFAANEASKAGSSFMQEFEKEMERERQKQNTESYSN